MTYDRAMTENALILVDLEDPKMCSRKTWRLPSSGVLCGRLTKEELFIHVVDGGSAVIPFDQEYEDESADLGFHPIGPDCAKKLPEGYAGRRR